MLKIEKSTTYGLEEAIRGMRNPMNSWAKSDSYWTHIEDEHTLETAKYEYFVGENDEALMTKLSNAGPVHGKFKRMITVYLDITAPLYWWKEFDTYKVGTVTDSCSTMHKIHANEFTMADFSTEHLDGESLPCMNKILWTLNRARSRYIAGHDKKDWWQMIQLLPSSYNQRRTVMLNYEVLTNIYNSRKDHKLDEWHTFCDWIETLPYAHLMTGEVIE